MAEIVTKGQRVVPKAAREHGYAFAHPDLDEALRSRAQSFVIAVSAAVGGVAGHLGLARLLAPLPRLALVPLGGSSLGGITSQMIGPRMERIRPVPSPAFSP